jgi:ABC-2 type transport system ATP-binding protein
VPAQAIQIEQVTKIFGGVRAVDDLTLTIPEGSIHGFIGPNGSGKTTTMRMVVGILHPDQGSIRVFGDEMTGVPNGKIGYLPEERGLYRKMRLRELLEFHGQLRGGGDIRREADEWMERLGLADWAGQPVETLSKGMSQKAQFIAAVLGRPRLLILDEPFTGLDPLGAESIREAILELRRRGATVVLSTHDMHSAETMCDSIFMIFRGKKVLDGSLSEIQERYGNDSILVATQDSASDLSGLTGVEHVRDVGNERELRLARGYDPQLVLRELVLRASVTSFKVARPSLHDIFIRIAGPASESAESTVA